MLERLPPTFYLSHARSKLIVLFSDVQALQQTYTSNPVVIPLPGMTVPYRAQGYGSGRTYGFQAQINAWHAFTAQEGMPRTAFRQNDLAELNAAAYQDFLKIHQLVEEYGPSPIMSLHAPNPNGGETIDVMLITYAGALPMSQAQANPTGDVYPHTIAVEMTLAEYRPYKIKVGGAASQTPTPFGPSGVGGNR